MKTFIDHLNESKNSDLLAKKIDAAIVKIDDSMSYKDFAMAVCKVMKDEYGQHLYSDFIKEIQKNLK